MLWKGIVDTDWYLIITNTTEEEPWGKFCDIIVWVRSRTCYMVLLPIDSKTRQQGNRSSMTWPIYTYYIWFVDRKPNHNSYQYMKYKYNYKLSQETVLYTQSQYLHIDAKGQVVYPQPIYRQFVGSQDEWNVPKTTMYIQNENGYNIAYRYNVPWNITTVVLRCLIVFYFVI